MKHFATFMSHPTFLLLIVLSGLSLSGGHNIKLGVADAAFLFHFLN